MTITLLAMIFIPLVLLIVILGFVTLNRYIGYKERVALAQLGFSAADLNHGGETGKAHGNRGVLWGGVITAMSGLALLLGLGTLGTGAWLLGGLIPFFVGLGMVLIYFVTLGPAPDATSGHSTAAPSAAAEEGSGSTSDGVVQKEPFATDGAPAGSRGKTE